MKAVNIPIIITNHDTTTQNAPKIPITRLIQGPFKKDEVLKEGLVLCTRIEQWYAKRHNGVKDIELRKTRMRWRRFYAVLRPDRLELYHAAVIHNNILVDLDKRLMTHLSYSADFNKEASTHHLSPGRSSSSSRPSLACFSMGLHLAARVQV